MVFWSTAKFNSYHPVPHPKRLDIGNKKELLEFYFNVVQATYQYKIHNDIPRWHKINRKDCPQALYDKNQTWLQNNAWAQIIKFKYANLCPCTWNGLGLKSCPPDEFFTAWRYIDQDRGSHLDRPIEALVERDLCRPKTEKPPSRVPLQELTMKDLAKSPHTSANGREIRRYALEWEVHTEQTRLDLREAESQESPEQDTVRMRGGRMAVPRSIDEDPMEMEQFQMEEVAREDLGNNVAVEDQLLFEFQVVEHMVIQLMMENNMAAEAQLLFGSQAVQQMMIMIQIWTGEKFEYEDEDSNSEYVDNEYFDSEDVDGEYTDAEYLDTEGSDDMPEDTGATDEPILHLRGGADCQNHRDSREVMSIDSEYMEGSDTNDYDADVDSDYEDSDDDDMYRNRCQYQYQRDFPENFDSDTADEIDWDEPIPPLTQQRSKIEWSSMVAMTKEFSEIVFDRKQLE